MRNIAVILSALMVVNAPGQEPEVKLPAVKQPPIPGGLFPQAPRAWLGFHVSKPDESITAHLPALPPGIGFVIRLLGVGGPAENAGLRNFDVLWKFEDQMLVNEGQLAALLRLRKPGDEVRQAT
jgi:S1-C subfamily serine protease